MLPFLFRSATICVRSFINGFEAISTISLSRSTGRRSSWAKPVIAAGSPQTALVQMSAKKRALGVVRWAVGLIMTICGDPSVDAADNRICYRSP